MKDEALLKRLQFTIRSLILPLDATQAIMYYLHH